MGRLGLIDPSCLLWDRPLQFFTERNQRNSLVDLTQHKAGIEAARNNTPSACSDPKAEAINILVAEGAEIKGTIQSGKLTRVKGERCKGAEKDFWYLYNEMDDNQQSGHIIGILNYGYWKDSTSLTWCSRSQHQMDTQERLKFHAQREAMKAEYERELAEKQAEAATKAFEIWSASTQATDKHGYLIKKGVKAHQGVKIAKDGRLIVPIAVDNEIVSMQMIDDNGEKRFLTGGKIKGGWFIIEGETDVIYIAEGYSTGASVAEATGKTVYISFNAGNLYEVTAYVKNAYPQSRIIISGDDDTGTAGNAGRTKAEQASHGLGLECVFPAGFVDFNDMHKEQGIDALKEYLNPEKLDVYEKENKPESGQAHRPTGILGDIFDYYNATSGNRQEGFAIQTALAIGSIILGRSYKTSLDNYPSLYFLNVGKTGTGKEHAKTVIEKTLYQSGHGHLIAGDGYTSAGAVFSTLLDRPRHISVIDEFGRYLEAGSDSKKGNQHQRDANTKLMEAITRSHSIIRPPSYSAMTLKKDAADAIKNRYVHQPSITLLTMTTPDTLFETLDMRSVKDGFVNRFIVSISDAQRDIRRHKPPIDVPDRIIRWINDVTARADIIHIATEPSPAVNIELSAEADKMQLDFQYECIGIGEYLERFKLDGLSVRSNELAMKTSLIVALSRDPHTKVITAEDMEWSINYIRRCMNDTIDRLKITLSHSDFEHQKKEILADLREKSPDGITWAQMQKTPPYSQHKPRDLKDILQSLKDANLAGDEPFQNPSGAGRPTVKWKALK